MKCRCIGTLLLLLILIAAPAGAQSAIFKPFTSFRVIQTEHFDIIFPKESEPSARLLASFADRAYDEVSSLLGITVPFRIPVTLNPHTAQYNAYYSGSPLPCIMLFDTAMDLEWTNYENNLESLFLHELTHAVSQNSRSRSNEIFRRIFGNWVTPTNINTPLFMVEGAAVSFESLSGFGRANDPLIKQKLRQAIYENKFLTPFQVSGVYDLPGQESMMYEYGGLFSAWLQQTYGMEKYAELWQAMGRGYYFSLFVYRSDYYHTFKKVYNVDFLDAWNAFSASLMLDGLKTNPDELLPKKHRFFSERPRFIRGIAAGKDKLYYINGPEAKISVYDTLTGKTRAFNTSSYYPYDIDVSADGTVLLLSGYRFAGDRAVAAVTEHRTNSGRRTGRSIKGLYKARYFRDGVIGIRTELHNNCIVYEDFSGKSEVLFRGNEGLVFSGPQAADDERIAFVVARNGIRELWLYNYVSRELFRIEDVSGNNEHWRYMRGLGVSEGKLFFSHNGDDRMYKLASINLETMQAQFSGSDFSGGVFNPVSLNGAVYYRGNFFSRDGLLRFPEPAGSFAGTQTALRLVKLDNKTFEITANGTEERIAQPYSGAAKPYIGILRYINPLQFWIPLPLIRLGAAAGNRLGLSLDGGGLLSLITDPTDRNRITILAYADIRYRMAMIDRFSLRNTALGFPLEAVFTDGVRESGGNFYRYTGVSLSGTVQWSAGRWINTFSPGGAYVRTAGNDGGESAYQWEGTGNYFLLSADFGFSNNRRQTHELFGTGLSLNVGGITTAHRFDPHVDGVFRASAEIRFPLDFTLFGSYDRGGMDLHGISGIYGERPVTEFTLPEYAHPTGLNLKWLAGGEAAVGLFSFEIQKHPVLSPVSHLYFNRFFAVLSVRNVLYDGGGHPGAEGAAINNLRLIQSLRLKLAIKATVLPFVKTPFSFEPYFLAAWKFSNTITGKNESWAYGFGAAGYLWTFSAGFNLRL